MRTDLPEAKEVWVQYVSDYYDGPVTGVCRWMGDRYYFILDDEIMVNFQMTRIYHLHPLTPDEWRVEDIAHAEWNACCGNGSYDLPPDHVPDPSRMNQFYKDHVEDINTGIPRLAPVAWFREDSMCYPQPGRW